MTKAPYHHRAQLILALCAALWLIVFLAVHIALFGMPW